MRRHLSIRELNAIIEALAARTAGEIDVSGDLDAPRPDDYDAALLWALEEIARRKHSRQPRISGT